MTREKHAAISVCCELLPIPQHRSSELPRARADSARPSGLPLSVASVGPLPARLRLSPVSTRKSEQAALSSTEHVARRPRPRVRRVVVNPLPHRTKSGSRSPANRRTPARHRGCGDSRLPLQRPCIRGLACCCSHTPHTTYHKPNARERYGLGGGGEEGNVTRAVIRSRLFLQRIR